jgi:adenosylhomocysteine nucleosidase
VTGADRSATRPAGELLVCVATRIEARLLPPTLAGARLVQCGPRADSWRLRGPHVEASARGVLSFGFAGGLAPALLPGTLLLPHRLRDHDGRLFAVNAAWRERVAAALGAGAPLASGDLLEQHTVVRSPAHKRTLYEATGAVAVDMESARLAALAEASGTAFLALRVIIDAAADELPQALADLLADDGRLRASRLPAAILSAPRALARLAWNYRRAARALRSATRGAWPQILQGSPGR